MLTPFSPMMDRIRQLPTISPSARSPMFSAIDPLPGSGRHFSCLDERPEIDFLSFAAVVLWTLSESCPSTYPKMRWMYCCAVSCMVTLYDFPQTHPPRESRRNS